MRYFNNHIIKLILYSYCLKIVIRSEEPVFFLALACHHGFFSAITMKFWPSIDCKMQLASFISKIIIYILFVENNIIYFV